MPGMTIGGKRGNASFRQQQLGSRIRNLRGRNLISLNTNDDAAAQKSPKEEPVKTSPIPPALHPSIPDLACLGNMGFELLLFLYLHTALFCQYIYLYKTVWWYPVTLPPSTTSLNFHLIDRNLTLFLSIFISRRLIWSVLWDFLRMYSNSPAGMMAWILFCFMAGITWVLCLITPLVQLFYSTSLLNMVVLSYPMLLWIPLTGLSGDSCLNLILSWTSIVDHGKTGHSEIGENGIISIATSNNKNITLTRLLSGSDFGNHHISYTNLGKSTDLQVIKREVKLLRQDFNSRVSEIVFCSMVCAYYVGLVPMFFMKSHQYYDMVWSLQHTVLVLLNSFGLLSSHLLNPQYLHVLHKCALLYGEYIPETNRTPSEKETARESASKDGEYHASRKTSLHRDEQMTSGFADKQSHPEAPCEKNNMPGADDATNMRFYHMFSDPLRLTNWLLASHIVIVLFQIYLLMSSSKWDHLISIALMQFFSYYVLFRTARDRIVLGKAHHLHDHYFKNGPP